MINRITQLLTGTHTEFFEVFNAVLIITWGSWLLLPFDSFGSSKAFTVLSTFVSEPLFALLPIIIGVYILYTLITFKITRRRYGILAASAFWIFLSIIIGISNIAATGVPVYGLIAISSAISYLRQ